MAKANWGGVKLPERRGVFEVYVRRNGVRHYGIGSREGTLDVIRRELEDLIYDNIYHYTELWIEIDGKRVAEADVDRMGRLKWWK
jgi:hypothetical protein